MPRDLLREKDQPDQRLNRNSRKPSKPKNKKRKRGRIGERRVQDRIERRRAAMKRNFYEAYRVANQLTDIRYITKYGYG